MNDVQIARITLRILLLLIAFATLFITQRAIAQPAIDEADIRKAAKGLLPIRITEEGIASQAHVTFEEAVVPLLRTHCFECHGNDSQSAELNLEQLVTESPIVVNRDKWINVLEQSKNRVMPPEGETQPSEEERTRLVLVLHNAVHNFDYSGIKHPGFEHARRLTHDEYDNTVRDLFGIDIRPTDRFPTDLIGSSGFDNSANTLFLQPLLMERYMGAADVIVDDALPLKPTTEAHRATRRLLLFREPNAVESEEQTVAKVFTRFLTHAYRRPATSDELERAKKSYAASRATGKGVVESAKDVFRTTLISPNFLMKSETLQEPDADFHIDDWELASRLSYFLWATMPDDELFDLARAEILHEPAVLDAQVQRMIADSRSETLGSIFAAQWLGSQHLGTRMRMDPIDNPWCTDSLMAAMRNETAMFFHTLVQENHPLPRLIDADFTFVNQELATQYNIGGVHGEEMQRISLQNSERGGIFGQASLLAVTSVPYRTSPVARGRWILADVLGTPPPPPPPNVSQLAEEIEENEKLSFREKLEFHRRAPNCYSCHSEMDPLGFSLEGYDHFGRERKSQEGKKLDVRGELPNGTEFEGLAGLKKVIVEQRLGDLSKQVTSKMLSYALGRQLEYYDEPTVRRIVKAVESDDYRLQTLIHEVVQSYPFQYKRSSR
jgi:hypothetical protein